MLLLQEFDIEILDRSGTHNLVADHLSKIENGEDNILIKDDFPNEVLLALTAVKGMFGVLILWVLFLLLLGFLIFCLL